MFSENTEAGRKPEERERKGGRESDRERGRDKRDSKKHVVTPLEKIANYADGSQDVLPYVHTAFLWDHVVPPSPLFHIALAIIWRGRYSHFTDANINA